MKCNCSLQDHYGFCHNGPLDGHILFLFFIFPCMMVSYGVFNTCQNTAFFSQTKITEKDHLLSANNN